MSRLLPPILGGLLVLIVGIFISSLFDLYSIIPHFDKMMHFAGGFMVAWFFNEYFKKSLSSFSWLDRLLILLGTVAFIGVLWEFAEFFSNLYPDNFPILHYFFYGGDLVDTIGDLAFDLMGGALFACIPASRHK